MAWLIVRPQVVLIILRIIIPSPTPQARGDSMAQPIQVTSAPEVQHGVVAHVEGAGHRLQRAGQRRERWLERLPRRIRDHCGSLLIHATATGAPGELLILIGGHQAHLYTVELAQAAYYHAPRRHIDP